jgi:hypothetical protein
MIEPVTIGRATLIYALSDECGRVRYVGKTVRTLRDRLGQHKRAARHGHLPVNRWIRKHNVSARLLETVAAGGDWVAREQYWIKRFDGLLNLTSGGEGLPGHKFTDSHKRKIAEALKTGDVFSCETCSESFWRKRNEIEKGDCRFCSRACYAASLKGVPKAVPPACIERGVAAAAKARRARTHCKRGHPLSGENLFLTSQGSRGCKECRKIHKRTYQEKARG